MLGVYGSELWNAVKECPVNVVAISPKLLASIPCIYFVPGGGLCTDALGPVARLAAC